MSKEDYGVDRTTVVRSRFLWKMVLVSRFTWRVLFPLRSLFTRILFYSGRKDEERLKQKMFVGSQERDLRVKR